MGQRRPLIAVSRRARHLLAVAAVGLSAHPILQAEPAGLECVIHDWAVPPGQWTGSGDTDPTGLLMTSTTRWIFHLADCSLTGGVCDAFGSGSRVFQDGVERPQWHATNTVPTIAAVGNTVTYDFAMRDAFVPHGMQPRLENMDWTLSAVLPSPPTDSPSAAELAAATSITVAIDHWVDIGVIVEWEGSASDTVFGSCTPVPTTLSVGDVSLAEGSGGGSTPFGFTVSRNQNTTAVSVTATTADGDATAGSDYTAFGPTVLSFTAGGSLSQTVNVAVAADDGFEADEGFSLLLSAPVNASLADDTGVATIVNDDVVAELSVDDVQLAERDAGASDLVFTVARSHNHDALEVTVATADDTAEAGSDYTAVSATVLTFAAGGAADQTVGVSVTGDSVVELDETLTLELTSPELATIDDGTGLGTIVNDDAALVSIDSTSVVEGTGGPSVPLTFTVTLDLEVDNPVELDFDTRDGSAEDETGDGDYAAALGTLTLDGTAGESATITVDVTTDARPELDETFFVDLSDLVAGGRDVTFAQAEGQGTIVDDDDACPGFAIYRQPFDSPADLASHPAESGGTAAFEGVVDGAGAPVSLPPGPVSALRVWGLGDDGGGTCTLDPLVPFTLAFHADGGGIPGALVAERVVAAGGWSVLASGVVEADLIFPPFEGGTVGWISVRRSAADGCAFRWLAEALAGSYDDQVFVDPAFVADDAYLCVGHSWVFADGFESGDTSAWNQTVP